MFEPKRIVCKYKGICSTCRNEVMPGHECYFSKQSGAKKGELECLECVLVKNELFGPKRAKEKP